MLGDSLKSLVKRRIGIAPGQRQVPVDQLDVVIVPGVTFVGTLLVNRLAFAAGLKDLHR